MKLELIPLSQETIFERRRKAQRDRWLLLGALLFGQGFFIYAMAEALLLAVAITRPAFVGTLAWMREPALLWLSLGAALLLTLLQAVRAWAGRRRDLRQELDAQPLDPDDERHQAFARNIQAVCLASGLPEARVLVTARAGFNSYGWQDPDGRAVIGISEGLLGRLNPAEQAALGAHHAAHIRFGDAALFLFAGSVVSDFDGIYRGLSKTQGTGDKEGGVVLPLLLVLLVSKVAALYTRVVFGLVVRDRKLNADAAAVGMTRDPLALAAVLHTAQAASLAWQGLPESLNPLLLVPASDLELGSHSPLGERLDCLLRDAHSTLQSLLRVEEEERRLRQPVAEARLRYWHYEAGAWTGPWDLAQLRGRPGFGPQSWVSPAGLAPRRALADEDLSGLFQASPGAAGRCPRCGCGLRKDRREGLGLLYCPNCNGHAVAQAALDRLVLRQEEGFSPALRAEALRLRRDEWTRGRPPADEACGYPPIRCPVCGGVTHKRYFSYIAKVVVDKCSAPTCGALWLDGGELELVQLLTEEPLLGTQGPRQPAKN